VGLDSELNDTREHLEFEAGFSVVERTEGPPCRRYAFVAPGYPRPPVPCPPACTEGALLTDDRFELPRTPRGDGCLGEQAQLRDDVGADLFVKLSPVAAKDVLA
jgi:hypothetical protein